MKVNGPNWQAFTIDDEEQMDFTDAQIERYARHIVLKEVGGAGQQRLLRSKVLVVGAGGLGCPLVLYLAALLT